VPKILDQDTLIERAVEKAEKKIRAAHVGIVREVATNHMDNFDRNHTRAVRELTRAIVDALRAA